MSFEVLLTYIGQGSLVFLVLTGAIKLLFPHFLARDKSRFNTTLKRVDDLRSKAYGNVWTLTGAFNLYGPHVDVHVVDLQINLRNWYFGHGQFLTPEAREWYFSAMELLGALEVAGVQPKRPASEVLYAQQKDTRTMLRETLRDLRDKLDLPQKTLPGQPIPLPRPVSFQSAASQPPLTRLIREFKAVVSGQNPQSPEVAEFTWIIMQEIFSRLRSRLTRDISGRRRFGLLSFS